MIKAEDANATVMSIPYITVGYRRYKPDGNLEDDMGKFFGKPRQHDIQLELHSIRVQRPESVANGADPENKVVWKNKPIAQTPVTTTTPAATGTTAAATTGTGASGAGASY